MAGSPGTQLAPDLAAGPRAALVIATTMYQDPELRQLRAPAHDARDLAKVLADPGIGAFAVTQLIDAAEWQARRAIDVFLADRGVGDLAVLYLSCHGVLDRRNRLYFAAADTVKAQLSSTGISAAWLLDQLEDCRARQQVVILDCCFSGAFAHGSKGDADLDLERRLVTSGRGQAILTASRAGEYSFEGQALPGAAVSGSVFTAGLIEGLRTGAADAGGDGYITVDEAYDYVRRYVQVSGASQTPQRWLSGGEGAIVLARSTAGIVITPAALPEDLAASLDSRYPQVRIGAVHELGGWLGGDDRAQAMTAGQKLRHIADTDNAAVAAAARAYLASPDQLAVPTSPGAHNVRKDETIPVRRTNAVSDNVMRRVEIGGLRLGPVLGSGGQGRVTAVDEYLIDDKWPAALKTYSAVVGVDYDTLEKIVAFPGQLPRNDRDWLMGISSWPWAIATVNGVPRGFLMRVVPSVYNFSFTTVTQGVKTRLSTVEYLLNPDDYVRRAGISISEKDRLNLLGTLAQTMSGLHALGVVVGDLSPKNLLVDLNSYSRCFIIDCDAMVLRGESAFGQVDTVEWEVPGGEKSGTEAGDSFKFGLLATRLFARDPSSQDVTALAAVSSELGRLAVLSQDRNPASRPSLSSWVDAIYNGPDGFRVAIDVV